MDVLGNLIQDVYDKEYKKSMICVNSIINNNEQYIVFGWTNKSNKEALKLINSFEKSDKLIEDLIYFLFVHFENICMNPSWYNGLDNRTKEVLKIALIEGAKPYVPRTQLFPLTDKLNLK